MQDPNEFFTSEYEDIDTFAELLTPPEFAEDVAEDHLRAMKYHRNEIVKIKIHADKELEKIRVWRDKEVEKVAKKAWWHETHLTNWFKRVDKATMKLINGTLKRTKGRESVEILDESLIPKELYVDVPATTKAPSKTALLALIKSTGEIPAGVDIVRGDDSYKIVTNED
jgi:hypothetical protein